MLIESYRHPAEKLLHYYNQAKSSPNIARAQTHIDTCGAIEKMGGGSVTFILSKITRAEGP